jgi:hypothetical protein
MKKEFLTYEQSLDMRAIGFNEPCLAYYDKDGDFLGDISVNEDTDNLYTNADFVMYQDFKVADVSAPTITQAHRWLRQKHNLYGWTYTSDGVKFFYTVLSDGRYVRENGSGETFDEAEQECLNKLIEIVKNK